MQRIYALNFSLGELPCSLVAVTPQRIKRPETPYYSHRHSVFEMFYLTRGLCTIMVGAKSYTVHAGQFILILPSTYHSIKFASDDICIMSIEFDIPPPEQLPKNSDGRLISSAFYASPAVVSDMAGRPSDTALCHTLEQIRAVAEKWEDQFVMREELRALSAILVLELFQKLARQMPKRIAKKTDAVSQRDIVIDEFFNIHFARNDGNELLAQKLRVSTRQLDRILRKNYGMNYREKLQEVRLEVSMDFLLTTDKSIAEISELVGYSSPANFSTFIKKATGKTPSKIRSDRSR